MSDFQLTPEQNEIIEAIGRGENILITGVAGTGKSFTIDEIRKVYDCSLTATTGLAAMNIGGCTIHSWAGIGIGDKDPQEYADQILYAPYKSHLREAILSCKRLIIDEASMLSDHLFGILNKTLQLVRGNDQPFGDIQLILTGDFLQLPPVNKEGNRHFCFKSPMWDAAGFKTYLLTQVFRQENQRFVELLNRVRMGECNEEDWAILQSRAVMPEHEELEPLHVYARNDDVKAMNARKLMDLQSQQITYKAVDACCLTIDDEKEMRDKKIDPEKMKEKHQKLLDKECLAPYGLNLKVGAQVMLIKNLDQKAGLVNGSMGIVEALQSDGIQVRFKNGQTRWITKLESWESKEGNKWVVMKRSQFPLRLAWAITVHKSQGMTLDRVFCNMDGTFEKGQAYVALSRCKTLEGLFVHGLQRRHIMSHPEAVEFYKQFKDKYKCYDPPFGRAAIVPNTCTNGHSLIALGHQQAIPTTGNFSCYIGSEKDSPYV